MSEWVERVINHPVFETLKAIELSLDATRSKAEAMTTDTIEALDRLSSGNRFIDNLLRRVDPILIVPAWLDPLNNSLVQVASSITQFNKTPNLGQLAIGNTHLDTALSHLSSIHILATPADIDDLREALSSFRRACGQLSRNLEIEVDKTRHSSTLLKTKLDELSVEITTQKKRLDDAITSFTDSFNTAQSTRNDEFSLAKEKLKTDALDLLKKSQESFSTFFLASKESIDKLQITIQENQDAQLKLTEKKCESHLSDISKHQDEAKRLVGIISMTGMVGGYQQVANKERESFIRWRRGTVFCMILLAIFGFYTFYTAVSPSFEPATFANRLFVTITLAILAGYSAFQADRHRKSEIENRRMELELASFDPFLASLADEERNELKKIMADRLFGRYMTGHSIEDRVSPSSIVDLLKFSINTISKTKS